MLSLRREEMLLFALVRRAKVHYERRYMNLSAPMCFFFKQVRNAMVVEDSDFFLIFMQHGQGDCELFFYPIGSNAKSLLFYSLFSIPGNTWAIKIYLNFKSKDR